MRETAQENRGLSVNVLLQPCLLGAPVLTADHSGSAFLWRVHQPRRRSSTGEHPIGNKQMEATAKRGGKARQNGEVNTTVKHRQGVGV